MKKNYRDLRVWNEAVDLVIDVYSATEKFPNAERFGLSSQMRRAAVSVPSNIAEGYGRMTKGEIRHFLGNARGSLHELETQIEIAARLQILSSPATTELAKKSEDIGRALNGLLKYVESRP